MSFVKPDRPGTNITFIGTSSPRVVPSAAETIAVPLISDWGPAGSDPAGADGISGGPQLVENFAEYVGLYGDSDTPGRTAMAGAFAGQGLPGQGGAGAAWVWRMTGSTRAKATATFQNRTPTAQLVLTGKYYGSRGNRISVIIDADPVVAANDRVRIQLDGVTRETYTRVAGMISSDFVALINSKSSLVTATSLLPSNAARLSIVPATPLVGGDDGATVASADWLDALAGLQFKAFGVIAPYDLTDSAIQASLLSWVQSQAGAMRPVRAVIGGSAGEALSVAQARTTAMSDPHVLNVGVGTYHDDLLGKDLSTSQLAPRIAGILAAKGQKHALTFSDISGLHVVAGPADSDVVSAINTGVVVLSPVSSPDAELHIEKDVTTFTATNVAAQPLDVFGSARLVGVMDNYIRDMKQWGDRIVIGQLPVNDDTRAEVRGQARALQDALQAQGLIEAGDDVTIPKPFVIVDPPANPSLDDAIPYTFGWQFTQTANYILGQGQIR